jgi:RNA polymerase sigma-70 factor (ECF subfamily)
MTNPQDQQAAEERFRHVFAHLGAVVAYARRRGSTDPDSIGAEVMTIAWRRLADVPRDDPRPWLYGTARNLVLAEFRRWRQVEDDGRIELEVAPAVEPLHLDSQLAEALSSLSPLDREALLLVAWEDLSPAQAARVLRINPTAFRVRLLRARRRLKERLAETRRRAGATTSRLEMERT